MVKGSVQYLNRLFTSYLRCIVPLRVGEKYCLMDKVLIKYQFPEDEGKKKGCL